MEQATGKIHIIAPPQKVWEALADLSLREHFSPEPEHSYYVTDEHEGLGSARRREFSTGFFEERVVGWDEDCCISLEAYQHKGMPVKNVVGHYQIRKNGTGTYVTHSIEYQPDGILGNIMMPVTRRRFQKEVRDLLGGLKDYLESARGWQVNHVSHSSAPSEEVETTDEGAALAA